MPARRGQHRPRASARAQHPRPRAALFLLGVFLMPMSMRSEWKLVNGFMFASADDCPDKAKLHRSDDPVGYVARSD